MSHLLRIVMVHGHLDGVVELALDGHSNICGTNASGKTTLQRLIPVFYGEQPNRVVPKTRKKFDDFYLPSSNSYLIYEYRREEGDICQVVLTRDAAGGVEYRFVKAAYEPEHYLMQTPSGVQGFGYSEFAARLRQLKIESSRKLQSTSEYRSVIQNDFTLQRGNHPETRNLRQMAQLYSLVSPGHRIRHMEKLVSAVHAKEGKMDTLKTMLAAIFEEDGVELPTTRIRNTTAREWIQQMRQSLRLGSLKIEFAALDRQVQSLAATEAELWRLYPLLQKDQAGLLREMADAEQLGNELTRTLKQHQQDHAQQQDELNGQLSEQRQALAQAERVLEHLQARYDDFSERDLPGLEADVAQLPQWRDDADNLRQHLQLIRAELGDSQSRLEQRKLALIERLEKKSTAHYQQISHWRDQQQQTREQQEQKKAALEQDYQQQRSAREAEFDQQQEALGEQLENLRARLHAPLTDAEVEQQALAQARLDQAQQVFRAGQHTQEQLEQELRQLQQKRQQQAERLTRIRQQVSQAETRCQELHRQKDPEQGSLRHFLRANQPGWEQTLGKVLRADLLERQDLSPRLLEDDEPRIFKLQLDIDTIALPDYAQDEAALLLAIEQAEQQLAQVLQEQQQAEKQLAEQNQQVEAQQQRVDQGRLRLDQMEQDIQFALDSRNRLQEEHRQLQQQRRTATEQAITQTENQRRQLREQRQQHLAALQDEFQAQLVEFKADWQAQLGVFDQQIRQVEQQLADLRREHQQQLKELQVSFDRELQEKQIDAGKLKEIEQRLQQYLDRIETTEQRKDELQDWKHFMQVDWARKPELLQEETRLKEAVRRTSQQLDSLKVRYREQNQQLRQQLDALHQQLAEQQRLAEQLKPLLLQLEQLSPPEQPPQAGEETADRLERMARAQAALRQFNQLRTGVQDALHAFERNLLKDADSGFLDAFETQRQQLQRPTGEPPSPQRLLPLMSSMLQLLEGQQQAIIERGRNIGGDLSGFFRVFRDLNRRINEQSRRLSQEVADDLELDGISRSEVRIQSTIDELGFWEPLKHFAALYEEWKASGELLPGDAYLDALASVAELLRSDQSYTFESLLRLELHLNEGGSDLIIRNDRQLLESSSHGMAYLILCKFLLAFTRLLRGKAQIAIHWPIDEIGTLAYHNVEKLFRACEKNRIHIVGAFPNPESDVLLLFKHRYLIERDTANPQLRRLKRIEPRLSRLAERLNERRQEVGA